MKVVGFGSAADYFEHGSLEETGCLIIDLQLPNDDAADLQQRLDGEMRTPVIFVSGQQDVPAAVRAMKAGAIDILTKPVNHAVFASTVHEAFAQSRRLRIRMAELAKLRQRYSLLTLTACGNCPRPLIR